MWKERRPDGRMRQMCVTMDRETMAEIDASAKAEGLTRSEWVRLRLEWALMDQLPVRSAKRA